MGASAFAWEIGEGHFKNAVTFRISLDQRFFDNLEVAGLKLQILQGLTPVKAKAARQVTHRHGQETSHPKVKQPAKPDSHRASVRGTSTDVTGGNDNVGFLTSAPQLRGESRFM